MSEKHKPTTTSPSRIFGFDIARALAVIGMVLVNFKVVMGAKGNGPAWLDWLMGLLDGRAAASFVILAGIGLSLVSHHARIANDRAGIARNRTTLLKRALFLFVVGLLYTPIWPADILHFYGVYIATAAFLLTASSRQLWGGVITLIVGFVGLVSIFDYNAGWNWETLDYTDFWTVLGMVRHIFFNGFHPVIPWLAFMLIGMWLGRQQLHDVKVRRRMLIVSLAITIFTEAISLVLTTIIPGDDGLMFDTQPLPPMPLYIVAGAATAIVIIMICLELENRYPNAGWLQPFIHTGQLALTLYVAHVIIGMGFLETIGRLENQTITFAAISGIIFSVLSVLFADQWRKHFQRGPLEWVMRKLTS